ATMRCIDVTREDVPVQMTVQTSAIDVPAAAPAPAGDGRRLLALPGIAAIIGALVMAGISFAVLLGLTPITPDEATTLTLIAINAAFILLLVALISREIHRIFMARRHGKAASRLH